MKAILFVSLKEAMRKKTFFIMLIVTVLYLAFWSVMLYNFESSSGLREEGEEFYSLASILILKMGLQFSSMLICLLTIMLGAGMIAADLENGLVLGIVSRPIKRSAYVIGKFLGVLILMAAFGSALFLLLMTVGAVFSLGPVVTLDALKILKGWLYFLTVPAAVLCITVFGSVVFKTVPNGLLMIFIYILGNIGGMVEMIGTLLNDQNVISGGIFISLLSPFHTLYTQAEQVLLPATGLAGDVMSSMGGLSGSGGAPSIWMFVYILLYAVGFVCLAVRKFHKIDINI